MYSPGLSGGLLYTAPSVIPMGPGVQQLPPIIVTAPSGDYVPNVKITESVLPPPPVSPWLIVAVLIALYLLTARGQRGDWM